MDESHTDRCLTDGAGCFFSSTITDDTLWRACLLKLSSALVTGTRLLAFYAI